MKKSLFVSRASWCVVALLVLPRLVQQLPATAPPDQSPLDSVPRWYAQPHIRSFTRLGRHAVTGACAHVCCIATHSLTHSLTHSGLLLAKLLKDLSGASVTGLNKNAKMKIHRINNLFHCFNVMRDQKMKLQNISAEGSYSPPPFSLSLAHDLLSPLLDGAVIMTLCALVACAVCVVSCRVCRVCACVSFNRCGRVRPEAHCGPHLALHHALRAPTRRRWHRCEDLSSYAVYSARRASHQISSACAVAGRLL